MAKQLNSYQVNLAFTADTEQAKRQLQDLQTRLSNLVAGKNIPGAKLGITSEIQEGVSAAAQLKVQLEQATNVNTGKLDLTKFSKSLKKNGMQLEDYAKSLSKLGPQGQEAFMQLTRSIANAEVPLIHVNQRLNEMWTTMKNTARWQLSSSVLHGFMGAVQSAYGYAQDLNESLNNIRIVSGQNTDQMAKFAEQANKAAKALNATTTDYTNAALIYYQQGLSGAEIEERTEVTLKMANVSRESAEVVSDQMTAVWNNFDDGSKSLEYYADVMTALGAKTASSTAEISDGLEKFAAVAETVGLSYEYATSSLATITATTRQSADVVGTALKTLFARIQGLSLGETLEDGVNLTKYSEALSKVGISIFEQNGELKAMDSILEEMGAKWQTLDKSQQTALAQTVAGVRQYTQLIALMDNWDFMQENLETAKNAEGALQEQADIYAESWEAASDRVRASLEAIYSNIIDDDFFIDILDGISTILDGVDNLMDSLGGIKPILTVIGALFLKTFSGKIADGIGGIGDSIVGIINPKAVQEKHMAQKKKAVEVGKSQIDSMVDPGSLLGKVKKQGLEDEFTTQQLLLNNAHKLTEEKSKEYQLRLDGLKVLREELELKAKILDKETSETNEQIHRQKLGVKGKGQQKKAGEDAIDDYILNKRTTGTLSHYREQATSLNKRQENLRNRKDLALDSPERKKLQEEIDKELEELRTAINEAEKSYLKNNKRGENKVKLDTITDGDDASKIVDKLRSNEDALIQKDFKNKAINAEVVKLGETAEKSAKGVAELNTQSKGMHSTFVEMDKEIPNVAHGMDDWKVTMTEVAGGIGLLSGGLMAGKQAVEEWSNAMADGEMTLEEFGSVAASTVGSITMISSGLTSLSNVALKGGKTLGETAVTSTGLGKAFGKLMPAAEGATASMGAQIATLGVYAAAAAAVIAVIALIAKEAYEAYNADAIAAKNAAVAAEELNSKQQELKSTLDEVKSTFEGYNSLLDTLKECDKGTDEWNEALKDVNDSMMDILQKYPELAKMDNLFNKDGTFNQDTIDAFIQKQEDNADAAQAASLMASARANQLQAKSDETDLNRSLSSTINNSIHRDESGVYVTEQDSEKILQNLKNAAQNTDSEGGVKDFNQAKKDAVDELVKNYSAFGMTTEKAEQIMDTYAGQVQEVTNKMSAASTQMDNVLTILSKEHLGNSDIAEGRSEAWKDEYETAYAEYNAGNFTRFTDKNDANFQKMLEDAGINLSDVSESNAVAMRDGMLHILGKNGESLGTVEAIQELAASNYAVAQANEAIVTGIDNDNSQVSIYEELQNNGVTGLKSEVDTATSTSFLDVVNQLADGGMGLSSEDAQAQIEEWSQQLQGMSAEAQENFMNQIIANFNSGISTEDQEIADLTSNAVANFELNAEEIEEQAKRIQDAYDLTAVEATKLAIENQRMNKGVESLSDNWEDWNKELKAGQLDKNKKLTAQYAKTVNDLTATIADLTGASKDLELPDEFFDSAENLELIEEASKGSEKAINQLGIAVGKAQVEMMEFQLPAGMNEDSAVAQNLASKFESQKSIVLNGLAELQAKVAEGNDLVDQGLDNILSGGAEGANSWVNSLNQMALSTNMTVDEMNSLLSSLGLEADVTVTEKTLKTKKPKIRTVTTPEKWDANGNITESTTYSYTEGYQEVDESVQIAQIATNGAKTGEPTVKYIGNGAVSASSKPSGGSGSQPKKNEGPPKSQVKRYKEVDDSLDNLSRKMSKASREADQLYGASRIAKMKENVSLMKQEVKLLEQKADEAERYKEADKAELDKLASEYGVTFKYNDDGTIANYTEQMEILNKQIVDAYTKAGEYISDDEQKKIDDAEERFNKLQEAIDTYDETLNTWEDQIEAVQEKEAEILDKNFDILNEELELKIEIEDSKMKKLEYLLNTFGDNFFKRFEALALMWDNEDNVISQFDVYKNKLNAYGVYDADKKEVSSEGGYVADLTAKYEVGDISRAKYIEGLKNAEDAIYEQLEALNELDQTMLTYYGETIDVANEELDDHTDHLEHLTSVFDHYMNLMDILGKSKDYEAMGNFLQGKADTLRDQLEVQKDWVDVLVKQEADAKKALDEAIADGDEAAVEPLKKNWDAARDALDEAQDEMLSMTEEWAEAMKAVTENNMKKIADTLEKTLTGGSTFETMMDSFDKLNKRQEEYLTKTNQIYETNKLMRTASKALDETDNKVAKTKLQNFIDETKSLQENTKLSQYELDIQQAKYDLLLAEIALEEAQNAKSTVRLSRDSEGNFGYVYTADQDKIDDAQQAVDDADNRLYNLSLEGQQEYTQKYLEAQEALYGELTALQEAWLNGEIANEEEYELRKAEILNHYFGPDGVLTTYQNLYNIAVRTDAKATEDYWGKEYALMTQDTEDWKIAVDQYLKDIETETKNWQEVSTKANEDVGEALSNSKDATEDLSTESENLKKTIVENVIPGLESELEAVQDLTEEYGNNRQAILDMIEAYKEYLETIGQEIENQSNSVSYDKNTDYTGLMQGYLAAGGKKGDANWNQLEAQREAKIVGEGYTKDYYGTKVGDSDYNIQSSNAYYVDREAVDKKLKELGIDPEPYATGGYTGAWGPEGKLAVLHEKELVLNAKDTENLLTTVSFIRDLVNMIDAQAGMASLFNMYATSGVMSNSESLEQVVTIHAEFPNASDRYEIEEAFNSLVNRASQYANRK